MVAELSTLPPLVTTWEVERLKATGTPIGLLPASNYTAGSTRLEPGDLLLLYTDGLNEAEDADQEQYGFDRLAAVCQDHAGLPLGKIAEAIEDDLSRFVGEVGFADDRTTVLIRRQPG